VVFLDALVLKIRDGGSVVRKAGYLALGVGMDGSRDVLGLWFQDAEGAKFWMQVLAELRHRGVKDILICCVDGLAGFPEAIEAVFPQTVVQTCIVHLIRASLRYTPRRQYDAVVRDLRPIYTAIDSDHARAALDAFEHKWGDQLPPGRPGVARLLGARHSVSGVPARGPPRDLHDKRDRGAQPPAAQSDQDQGQLPHRGRRPQAHLPRHPQRRAAMDPNPRVDQSAAGVQNPLRRPTARLTPTQILGRPPRRSAWRLICVLTPGPWRRSDDGQRSSRQSCDVAFQGSSDRNSVLVAWVRPAAGGRALRNRGVLSWAAITRMFVARCAFECVMCAWTAGG
jgi:putative transposase